jgi:hypothetical protein
MYLSIKHGRVVVHTKELYMKTFAAFRRFKLVALAVKRNLDLEGLTRMADLLGVKGSDNQANMLAGILIQTGRLEGVKDSSEALDAAVTDWSVDLETELDQQG